MPKKVYVATILIIALFVVNFILLFNNSRDNFVTPYSFEEITDLRERAYILPISAPNYIPVLDSNIIRPSISAKSALVYDTSSSRFLYDKNIEIKLPIASLTKIMTAVTVLENLSLDDIVTIAENSIRVDGEKQDLYLGEKISIRNLLKLLLIESSNDAAYALADYAKKRGIDFVVAMNAKAGVLAMGDTFFSDPAGLNDNAYSTVKDLAKLVEYSLVYREIWDISSEKTAIVESSDERIKHEIRSTNRLLGLVKDIVGGKTGFTDGALQCMILVTGVSDYPGKLISIVLGSQDRFGDTQKLIEWTRGAYRWK
ncbi:MAG: D-alanyl-D-alanine carboxypeptidase [Candidatus Yanofskybacteria bacterium]|nr:D-alanyl-D-alanine carboxypeptidase [Candidatus Yanofskybacteria bacterium]